MDGHAQERNGIGAVSGAKRNIQPPRQEHFAHDNAVNIYRVKFRNLSEKGSDLLPLFLLLAEGHIPREGLSEYVLKKTRKEFTSVLYPISTNNSISKEAKTMQTVTANGDKTRSDTAAAGFKKRIGSTVYTVSVHFSKTSRETIEDKILRRIESEARKPA